MNVLGYEEALVEAEIVEIEEGWTIKVASVPALIVLKLIAWQDRGGSKDLQDISFILQNYFEDSLYERLEAPLIKETINFAAMGPFGLGQNIRTNFSPQVVVTIDQILERIILKADQLIPQLLPRTSDDWDLRFDQTLTQFQNLRRGLKD